MKNKILKIAAIIFIAAFTLGFLSGAITEFTLSKNYSVVSEVYTVQKGDTLMDICLYYRKQDDRDPYIFEFMDEIRKINPELVDKQNQIFPGDKLNIQYKVKGN